MLQEDPKIGTQLSENEKRVLVDRYLEVSFLFGVNTLRTNFIKLIILMKLLF